MPNAEPAYKEDLLQWIWEGLRFDLKNLKTGCGKAISIHFPGRRNHTDGPDFLGARIEIDGILWFGDVEIHKKTRHWFAHGHNKDKKYNRVILHVVFEACAPVYTENGSMPFCLNLFERLPRGLHSFLEESKQTQQLPCHGLQYPLQQKAFEFQLGKARAEYFEKKANDFLNFYNPHRPMSEAWKTAYCLAIFDALGVPHNREAMVHTGKHWLKHTLASGLDRESNKSISEVAEQLLATGKITWNSKQVMPASHPRKRIRQAAEISIRVMHSEFGNILSGDVKEIWRDWSSGLSKNRNSKLNKRLFTLCHVSAFYVLSSLLQVNTLKNECYRIWENQYFELPINIVSLYLNADLISNEDTKNPGLVHQYRNWCTQKNCTQCFVLKNAKLS